MREIEVSGSIPCDQPIFGELSKLPYVYCETRVTEHFLDSDGGTAKGDGGERSPLDKALHSG